jgi:hypothetical protein
MFAVNPTEQQPCNNLFIKRYRRTAKFSERCPGDFKLSLESRDFMALWNLYTKNKLSASPSGVTKIPKVA